MCPLRRVKDTEAGPRAIGLLLPPGLRTFLIIRPRALASDLLLLDSADDAVFPLMDREEGTGIAQDIYRALEDWIEGGDGEAAAIPSPDKTGFWFRVRIGGYFFLACPRRPAQPYQPQFYPDEGAARAAAEALVQALCPGSGVEQEIYFNLRHFSAG